MQKVELRHIIIAVLCVLYAFFPSPLWLAETDTPYLLRAGAYSLFHENIFHLAVNCLSAWLIFSPKRKHNCRNLFTATLIAVAVYPLQFRPILGFSNVLFGVAGLLTPPFSNKAFWRNPVTIVSLVLIVGMVFVPSIAGVTHIAAYLAGIVGASLFRYIDYAERVARNR